MVRKVRCVSERTTAKNVCIQSICPKHTCCTWCVFCAVSTARPALEDTLPRVPIPAAAASHLWQSSNECCVDLQPQLLCIHSLTRNPGGNGDLQHHAAAAAGGTHTWSNTSTAVTSCCFFVACCHDPAVTPACWKASSTPQLSPHPFTLACALSSSST